MDLLNTLKEDHQRLLIQVEELDKILKRRIGSFSPATQEELQELLQRFIQLLLSHIEGEKTKFFPNLLSRLPEADRWQVRMVEVQYEMLLSEARHLSEFVSGVPSSILVKQLKESVTRLARWMREHVTIEEERLFPKLQGPPEA